MPQTDVLPVLKLFIYVHWRFLWLVARNLWPPRGGFGGRSLRHVLAMIAFVPAFYLLLLFQWLGLLLDEIIFRGYRRIDVREPVFVLGVPRSGTTFVHEVLADDEQYSTFSTWECFFAASVTWKKVFSGLAAFDRRLGAPLRRAAGWVGRRLAGRFDDTHPVRLSAPEEDFFSLVPILACFMLVVPFPDSPDFWRMAAFDEEMPEPMRSRILWFYRSCVQRHLYHFGPRRRFLSKNASFAPMVGSLLEIFPEARVFCCVRDPIPTVSSQLSVLADGMAMFDNNVRGHRFRDRMMGRLEYYYRNLFRNGDRHGRERWYWLTLEQIRGDLPAHVARAYERFGLTASPAFRRRLAARAEEASNWSSNHGHRLADFDLMEADIERRFDFVYRRFSFDPADPDGQDLRVLSGGRT